MRPKIHPKYEEVLIRCVGCGTEFVTRSTRLDINQHETQGRKIPSMALEICAKCHPFFTGKQTIVDTAGRVEKFNKRYGKALEKK